MQPRKIYIRPHSRKNGQLVKGHTRTNHKNKPSSSKNVGKDSLERLDAIETRQEAYAKTLHRSKHEEFFSKMKALQKNLLGLKQEFCWIDEKTGLGKICKIQEDKKNELLEIDVRPKVVVCRECFMMDTDFSKALMDGAKFLFDHMFNNAFRGTSLKDTLFANGHSAVTKNIVPERYKPKGRSVRWAGLEETSFEGACLRGAKFIDIALREVDFSHADLQGAQFINVDFSEVDFYDADVQPKQILFSGTNWSEINYHQYSFEEASHVLNLEEKDLEKMISTNQIEVRDNYKKIPVQVFDPSENHIPQWEIQRLLAI